MAFKLSVCPYRLLFNHPFATSHGVREGTDSIFLRLETDGATGHGEITLPPYLPEKPQAALEVLRGAMVADLMSLEELSRLLDDQDFWTAHPGCRAGLHMAYIDVLSQVKQSPVPQILKTNLLKHPKSIVTLGISEPEEVPAKLRELPPSDVLKVKMDGPRSIPMLKAVLTQDDRPVFIDANQGLGAVQDLLSIIAAAAGRLLAMEQPFPVGNSQLQATAQHQYEGCIYGDESIQGMADLEAAVGIFKGVNIKLMKCGGLDRAKQMADRAAEMGMQVMLGSMSESSLGCTAMAHLAGQAELIDLDGPWLLRNDPFRGMDLRNGRLVMPRGPGIGATPIQPLQFEPVCT
jgi:L-alanine-DL-glutamate epimerase-like enolase superfamily enzyme